MSGPKTYAQANKKPSRKIWPGCGDGRKRWCGRIHDYSDIFSTRGEIVHSFECHMNHERGCPQPIPEPKVSYEEWLKGQKQDDKD